MFASFGDAFSMIFQWPIVLLPILGTFLGQAFGILPGLSGATAIAILLPITFEMSPHEAVLLLIAAQGGSAFGGSITAILLNAPGESVNAATCLDGYPLAQQGRAAEAIGAAAAASAFGAIVGILLLMIILPFMSKIVLWFGPPEFFVLALFGLTMVAVVTEGSLVKALIASALGLILTFIGNNPVLGGVRYTFGVRPLWDGIQLIPAIVGLFAVTECLSLLGERRERIASQEIKDPWKQVLKGVLSIFVKWKVFLRSSIIGYLIGVVPGVGGAVANFVSYGQAVTTSPEPETFGKGNIEGVIAPEAANDAKDGGALLPTLTLGIPGSAFCAVFLGAFVLHGITPGRELLTEHMDIVWLIILGLLISNILSSVLGLVFIKQIVKIAWIPVNLVAPCIFIIALIGVYSIRMSYYDTVVTIIMAILGFLMKKYRYPRISIVLAIVLGPLAERSFHQSIQLGGWMIFFSRPITIILSIATVVSLVLPYMRKRQREKREGK
jgi:putative tricarboxylic transport membrane protein